MDYSEEVNESTRKILQKIEDQTQKKMKGKSVFHQKIICPSKIICDTFNKKKVLLMFIQCQPLPLEHFISYSFTYPQILRILKEGVLFYISSWKLSKSYMRYTSFMDKFPPGHATCPTTQKQIILLPPSKEKKENKFKQE